MPIPETIRHLPTRLYALRTAVPPRVGLIGGLCIILFAMQAVVAQAPIRTVLITGEADYLLVPDLLTFLFAIHGVGLSNGFFWTPVTYLFLHGSLIHPLLNLIGLLTFGSALENEAGARAMTVIFVLCGIAGGVGWTLANGLQSAQPCIGASAGVLGLVGAYAAIRPKDRFALYLPIPLVLPAWALAGMIFLLNAFERLIGKPHIAYSAHLIGIVFGILCGIVLRRLFCPRREPHT